jgi:hypothetical protein
VLRAATPPARRLHGDVLLAHGAGVPQAFRELALHRHQRGWSPGEVPHRERVPERAADLLGRDGQRSYVHGVAEAKSVAVRLLHQRAERRCQAKVARDPRSAGLESRRRHTAPQRREVLRVGVVLVPRDGKTSGARYQRLQSRQRRQPATKLWLAPARDRCDQRASQLPTRGQHGAHAHASVPHRVESCNRCRERFPPAIFELRGYDRERRQRDETLCDRAFGCVEAGEIHGPQQQTRRQPARTSRRPNSLTPRLICSAGFSPFSPACGRSPRMILKSTSWSILRFCMRRCTT